MDPRLVMIAQWCARRGLRYRHITPELLELQPGGPGAVLVRLLPQGRLQLYCINRAAGLLELAHPECLEQLLQFTAALAPDTPNQEHTHDPAHDQGRE